MDYTPDETIPPEPIFLGLAEKVTTPQGRIRIRLLWSRILLLLAALCVAGWFAKSVSFFLFFKYYLDYDRVSFASMVAYPLNRAQVRESFGNYHVEMAKTYLQQGKFREASMYARFGLARAPANLEGRYLVAQFESFQRPDVALKLLEDGLQYAEGDLDYLRFYLRMLLQQQEDDKIRDLARKLLQNPPVLNAYHKMLAMAAAQANYFRGAYDGAEELITAYQLDQTIDGVTLLSQMHWNRGLHGPAKQRLEVFANRFPGPKLDPIYAMLARFARDEGEDATALKYTVRRSTFNPFSAQPRVDLLYLYHKLGDSEKEKREADAILDQFRNDQAGIQALANFATDTGDLVLARRIYEMALENNFSIPVFGLLFIEAHLVAKDFRGAVDFCNELIKENPAWLPQYEGVFNGLRALAHYGIADLERGVLYLNKFLQSKGLRVETLISLSKRFDGMGFQDQARSILVTAYQMDAANQLALSEIVRIDLAQGNSRELAANLRQLLLLRRPSYDLLRQAYQELNSDRFIFTQNRNELLIELAGILQETTQAPRG